MQITFTPDYHRFSMCYEDIRLTKLKCTVYDCIANTKTNVKFIFKW
jgi:hypothetical protein